MVNLFNEENFEEEVLQTEGIVLVDFYGILSRNSNKIICWSYIKKSNIRCHKINIKGIYPLCLKKVLKGTSKL